MFAAGTGQAGGIWGDHTSNTFVNDMPCSRHAKTLPCFVCGRCHVVCEVEVNLNFGVMAKLWVLPCKSAYLSFLFHIF